MNILYYYDGFDTNDNSIKLTPSFGAVHFSADSRKLTIHDAEKQHLILATEGDSAKKLFELLLEYFGPEVIREKDAYISELEGKCREMVFIVSQLNKLVDDLHEWR